MPSQQLCESQTNFGLNILSTLPPRTSQVFSPLSISLGLALVHTGARGACREELENTLGVQNFGEIFGKLIADVQKGENGVETSVANRVFANSAYSIIEDYLEQIETKYRAAAESLDFAQTEESAVTINRYIEESTGGKIKDLISSDSLKDAFAILVNAVYFKADWLDKFEKTSTLEIGFEKEEGDIRQLAFLNDLEAHRDYTENDQFQVVSLPYVDTNFSFVIFLPKERFGLEKALKNLTGSKFQALLGDLKNSYINLRIPKMHIETEVSLRESLEKVGIKEMFSESADLSGMAPGVHISSGVHKSIIEVDEDGTTAAAATALKARLEMMIMAEPTEFLADHPFLFGLLYKNQPLFLGTHY